MQWNFAELDRARRYKLLVGLVVPRRIALITSLSAEGVVNASRKHGRGRPHLTNPGEQHDPDHFCDQPEQHANGQLFDPRY